jgi:hypothetical protein
MEPRYALHVADIISDGYYQDGEFTIIGTTPGDGDSVILTLNREAYEKLRSQLRNPWTWLESGQTAF